MKGQRCLLLLQNRGRYCFLESYEDKQLFLDELGLEESGVNRLIKKAYALLNLETFITAGEVEVRAWTYHKGWKHLNAQELFTQTLKRIIRAEVIKLKTI